MKWLRKKEKGFTLLELLIVVAILGLLIGLVTTMIYGFRRVGERGAQRVEKGVVQTAVRALMIEQGVSDLSTAITNAAAAKGSGTTLRSTSADKTSDMSDFPYKAPATGGSTGTDWDLYPTYIDIQTTRYKYWVESNGTVHQE